MIRIINSVLIFFGIQVKRAASLSAEKRYYEGINNGAKELYRIRQDVDKIVFNDKIAALAFSKDRPLQLHALLSSYFKLVSNPAPIDIIYKTSTIEIEGFYQELASDFSSFPIRLIKEQNFYTQVIHWLENVSADRIFFLTDDAVFLEEMDLHDCLIFNPIREIFSIKHGKDLVFCFAYNRPQELPGFEIIIEENELFLLRWIWNTKIESPDWSYPLSVDGNIFFRNEILAICRNISFMSPNSFEGNMQVYKDYYACRYGICYPKVKMINVPCNVVQIEYNNRITGMFTAEELLLIWQKNERIVVDDFYKLNASEAVNLKYRFA
jgi:hypothetical protein